MFDFVGFLIGYGLRFCIFSFFFSGKGVIDMQRYLPKLPIFTMKGCMYVCSRMLGIGRESEWMWWWCVHVMFNTAIAMSRSPASCVVGGGIPVISAHYN